MAERPRLTPEQRAAIEVDGDAAVRAGAGSGKTTVLAQWLAALKQVNHAFVRRITACKQGAAQ